MKRLTLLLAIALFSINSAIAQHRLFSNGKSRYSIVVCDDASKSELTAAKELQDYLKQISGAELQIKSAAESKRGPHIFIGYNPEYGKLLEVEQPAEKSESFTYRTVGKNIWIYGGKERGTMYGVYSFLEHEFGVRWYTQNCTKLPKADSWSFSELNHSESPSVDIRFTDYFDAQSDAYLAHNKLNSIRGSRRNHYGNLVGFWGNHTFKYFVPSQKYFATHPEYFSLRGGERKPNTQLCLSNPEVLEICTQGMLQLIKDNPDYWAYSLAQDDNQAYCQCEKCTALANKYGGQSGLIIWFVNQVADVVKEHYPDKYIGTFAYQYTRSIPSGITPRDNVVIRLCSLECCFAHTLTECDHNKAFVKDLEDWSKVTNNLYIWDYVTNFRYYLAPFPNFYVLAENMKTFLSHNVIGIYEEGQYESSGGSFAELRAWVISQLLWNPEQDTKALVKEFIDYCYGAAAPYVQEYFDLCHSQVKDGVVWGLYYHEWHPMFTEEFMTKATELARKAREAVKDEGEDLKYRVDLVDLQLKFLHLVRKPKEAMEDGTYEYFNDFIRRHNIIVSEWRYGPKGWIEYYNKTYINK